MKQVVFIAGTAYSGSSMLDMMLGSADSSFSVGEVRALFYPTKKYHVNPPCGCGDRACDIWKTIKEKGVDNLYSELFKLFGNVNTIIDSSKDPFWIAKQQRRLKKIGIKSQVLLIWKNPEEFALSRLKRGQLDQWDYAWVNYHRLFFSLMNDSNFRSLRYKDLAVDPENKLKQICLSFGIQFSSDMLSFWKQKHHMLFGNTSAKYHMYEKNNPLFNELVENLSEKEIKLNVEKNNLKLRHRSIFYEKPLKKKLPDKINSAISKNVSIIEIAQLLRLNDVDCKVDLGMNKLSYKHYFYPKIRLLLVYLKYAIKYNSFKIISAINHENQITS